MNDDELDKLFDKTSGEDNSDVKEKSKKVSGKLKSFFARFWTDIKTKRECLPNFPLSFRTVLIILLALCIVFLVCLFIFAPFFRVQRIVVEGNNVLTQEDLMEASGIKMNSHLFNRISGDILDVISLDYGKIEDEMLSRNPYIKDIQISVSFPSTVNFKVVEREKVAYIKMPDGYAAIDDEGTVIEISTLKPDNDCHAVICGLQVSSAVLFDKIKIDNELDYKRSVIVLGAILAADLNGNYSDYQMFSSIEEIRIIPGGNIFLTILIPTGSHLQVKLNSTDSINDAMSWLRYAIVQNSFDNLADGSLDMTGDEYIYREYS